MSEHKTTVRFSGEFNEELRVTMAKRRVGSLQAAVDQALRKWIDDGPPGNNSLVKAGDSSELVKNDRDKKIADALLQWFKQPIGPDEDLNLVMKVTLAKVLHLTEYLSAEERQYLRKKK